MVDDYNTNPKPIITYRSPEDFAPSPIYSIVAIMPIDVNCKDCKYINVIDLKKKMFDG